MAQLANLTTTLAIESASFVNGIEQSRGAVRKLVASLDPAAAAQAKFNRQMDLAERGLKSGQLSADLYEKVVARLKQRLDAAIVGGSRLTQTNGQMRAGMQQLSYQLSDVATMWSMGAKPMQIFASQSSQVIQALQLMGGESKGLLGILGGPWGIAISAATSVAVALAGALFKSKDASAAARDGFNAAAEAADRLAESMKRVNGVGTTVAMQDWQNVADAISLKQIEITKLQNKLAGGPTVTGRSANFGLQVTRDQAAERALQKAKDELTTLQANEKLAKIRLQTQERIQAAQDKYSASQARSTARTRESTSAISDNTKAIKAANEIERQRLQIINSLQDKFDPAAAAARDYADALKQIASVKLDPETAARYADAARVAFEKARAGMFTLPSVEGFRADADATSKAQEEAARAAKLMEDKLQRQKEDNIRDLAGLYQDLFTGGTKALWRDFEQMGFHVLAELLAKQTLAGGGGGGFFGVLFSVLKGVAGIGSTLAGVNLGGFNVGSIATDIPFHFANGGSFQFGGKSGIDQNILSLNGSPIAKVTKGETATITPAGAVKRGDTHIHISVDARNAVGIGQVRDMVAAGVGAGLQEHDRQQMKKATRRLGR